MTHSAGSTATTDMEQTLSQILTALYQAHATIDSQQRQIAGLEQTVKQLSEIRDRVAEIESERLPEGWRLVKES